MSERERDVEYERLRNELIDSAVDQENARRDNDDMAYLEATNAAIDAMEALDTYVNTLAAELYGLQAEVAKANAARIKAQDVTDQYAAHVENLQTEVGRLREATTATETVAAAIPEDGQMTIHAKELRRLMGQAWLMGAEARALAGRGPT
jgi:hypothetical protein